MLKSKPRGRPRTTTVRLKMSEPIPDTPDPDKRFSTQRSSGDHGFLDISSPCGFPPLRYYFVREEVEKNKLASTFSNIVDLLKISLEPFDKAAEEFGIVLKALHESLTAEQENKPKISMETIKELTTRFNEILEKHIEKPDGKVVLTKLSSDHLSSIIELIYDRNIEEVKDLNNYVPWTPEVYGETTYDLVSSIIEQLQISENDTFLDLGSGVGNVVIQVAARCFCKKTVGIEIVEARAEFAKKMDSEFRAIMGWLGKMYGDYELTHGDFLDYKDVFQKSNIIFTNNYAFSPELNLKLKMIFSDLPEGVKILVSKSLTDEKFRINEKTCNDASAVLPVRGTIKGKVSWTDGDVTFFIHEVDRTTLDRFLKSREDPDLRAQFEEEQRLGRPNYYESSSEPESRELRGKSDLDTTEDELTPKRGCTTRSQWNRSASKRKRIRGSVDDIETETDDEESDSDSADSESSEKSERMSERTRSLPPEDPKTGKRKRGRPPKAGNRAAPVIGGNSKSALQSLHKYTIHGYRDVDRSHQPGSVLAKTEQPEDALPEEFQLCLRLMESAMRKYIAECRKDSFPLRCNQELMMAMLQRDQIKKQVESLTNEVDQLRSYTHLLIGNIFKAVGISMPKSVENLQQITRTTLKSNQLLKSRWESLKDHLIWLEEAFKRQEEWAKQTGLPLNRINGTITSNDLMPPPANTGISPVRGYVLNEKNSSSQINQINSSATPRTQPATGHRKPDMGIHCSTIVGEVVTNSRFTAAGTKTDPPMDLSQVAKKDGIRGAPVTSYDPGREAGKPNLKSPNVLSAMGLVIENALDKSKMASPTRSNQSNSSVASKSDGASPVVGFERGREKSSHSIDTVQPNDGIDKRRLSNAQCQSSGYLISADQFYPMGNHQYAAGNLLQSAYPPMIVGAPYQLQGNPQMGIFGGFPLGAPGNAQVSAYPPQFAASDLHNAQAGWPSISGVFDSAKIAASVGASFSAIPGIGGRRDKGKVPDQNARSFEAITPPPQQVSR